MPALQWTARVTPAQVPAGLVASGLAAHQVLAQLRTRSDAQLAGLSAVATRDMLVVLGRPSALPWADGVRYCAPDALHPLLWLPTHMVPDMPLELVLANLIARGARVPFLLWHEPEQVLPLDQDTVLNRARLAWLEQAIE